MMHPMMPPATGPTGALFIMLRDATSSSIEEIEKTKGGEGVRRVLRGNPKDEEVILYEIAKDFRWLKKWQ